MANDQIRIQRALISVSDKTGVVEFAKALAAHGVELLSTGGTAKLLASAGLPVIEVGDYTGFPEMMDGRVKTLHPKVHGGILARRDMPEHVAAMKQHGIPPIDMVVVNLYPVRADRGEARLHDGRRDREHRHRRPRDGARRGQEPRLRGHRHRPGRLRGAREEARRERRQARLRRPLRARRQGLQPHRRVRRHDLLLAHGARREGRGARVPGPPEPRSSRSRRRCATARTRTSRRPSTSSATRPAGTLARFRQLQGKELSYNNIADADAAWECCRTFDVPACVIVKHANPCGVAIAQSPLEAYRRAFLTDPTSAFGGIIAFNRPVDGPTAEAVSKQFVEVVIAPVLRRGGEEGVRAPSRTCGCSRSTPAEGPEPPRHEARGRRAAGADRRTPSTSPSCAS